ncbi:MAG TPA: hypothetical protein VIN40_01395 [Candidatus Tyrphobacter sp.]
MQSSASPPVLLRPLGVGEIIDRALSLYVRNFVVFTATVLVVILVPFGIGEYLLAGNESGQFAAIFQVLQHPGTPPPASATWPFGTTPLALVGLAIGMFVIGGVLTIFAYNAVAVNVAALYTGRRPSIEGSLRAAFARWRPLIALLLLEIAVGIGAYVALVLLVFGVVFAVTIAGASFPGAGRSIFTVVLLVLLALVLFLALFVVAMLVVVALAFAGYAVVVERKGAIEALGSGFGRIFNRKEWGKAFLITLVAILVSVGISSISGAGDFVLIFVPGGHVLEAIWSTLFSAISASVQTVFYAVYYYDVRIRREGFDLEVALARLTQPAP